MKTRSHERKHRTIKEEQGFDFRKSAARHLVSAELRRFSADSVIVHPPDVCCRSGVSLKSQQKARNMCKPLINHVCIVILEHLRKKKLVFLGAPWPVWTLSLACGRKVQAMGKLGVKESRISLDKREVMGETVLRKPGLVFVPPSMVEQNVKRKTDMDLAELPKTASLDQVTNLMREIQQQDVCDMEVDLAEVMWRELHATVWNTLAHELETVVECLPAVEDDVEDMEMPGHELRDGSEVEEQEPMEDGEQRDGSVAEHAGHSKRDLERVKKALVKLHVNLGHPGVNGIIRVLKHGRASELAVQEARRMRCDVCAGKRATKASSSCGPSSGAGFQRTAWFGHFQFT